MEIKVKYEYDKDGKLLNGLVESKISKEWYRNGLLHRDKGPAKITYDNGKVRSVFWYKDGLLHRDFKPAEIRNKGKYRAWHKQGRKVKIDDNGYLEFYNLLGQLHKTDGPAVIKPNGDKEWYRYGKLDRDDGPAIELHDGYRGWFTNGMCVSDCGENFTKCEYDEKVDLERVSEIFMDDINELIIKYDSLQQYKILSTFLKKMLGMFDLVVNRDELLKYKETVLLMDHPQLCSKKCKEKVE